MGHFTAVCLVTWPMTASEAQGEPCFYADLPASLHKNNMIYTTKTVVCIKTRSPAASLSFKGQVTEQTTVKWFIVF